MSEIGWGTFAGLCTGLATLFGALPVLFSRRPSTGQQAIMLGFAAGVMISASYLSLIVPAAKFARDAGHGPFGAAAIVAAAVFVGAASLHAVRQWSPFESALVAAPAKRRAWLLTLAMTSHNLPEGAAVGVAFLLGAALVRILRQRGWFATRAEPRLMDLLDIVALGTVADVASLRGLNRAFVAQGIKVMAGRRNIGLAALIEASRLERAPTCTDLGFALGPRIHAGGRVGKSDLGVRLLTTEDRDEARIIAAELDRLNEERRTIEKLVQEEGLDLKRNKCEAMEGLIEEGQEAIDNVPKGPLRERHRELMKRWESGDDHGGVTYEELRALLDDWRADQARRRNPKAAKTEV